MIGIGTKVGRLTVEERTDQRKAGYIVWKCRCACGGEILLDTRCLQRGSVKDCGCGSAVGPGQRDISGMRFGRLTAVRPTEERGQRGSVVWLCRCDCGKEVYTELGQLTAGYKKSCGCLCHPPVKNFTGKKFGWLTVTEYAGKSEGMHQWKCRCICGQDVIVGQTRLQSGKTKSCGCLRAVVYKDNLGLREGTSVTKLKAIKSGRLLKSNTSGYNGVYFDKKRRLWIAQITFQGRTRYLGSFDRLPDAVKARQRGEEIYDEFLERVEAADNGGNIFLEEPAAGSFRGEGNKAP